jgi:DNA-binding NarL/FixJ family response regulator
MEKLIVDDHTLFNDGFKSLLSSIDRFSTIHQVYDSKKVLGFLQKNQNVQFIFMDINMPEMNGKELSIDILKHFPDKKILVLTMYADNSLIEDFKKIGVHGYLLKTQNIEEVAKAILTIQQGNNYFLNDYDKNVNENDAFLKRNKLSGRELEVLKLISQGKSNLQISEQLFLSIHTIISHRKNIHLKLNIQNERELIKFGLELGK